MDSVPKNFAKDVNKFFKSEESVAFVVKKMNLNLGLYQGKGDFDAIIYRNPGDTTKRASLPKIISSTKTQNILDRFENNGCISLEDYNNLVSENSIDKETKTDKCDIQNGQNDHAVGVKKSVEKEGNSVKTGTANPYLPVLGIAYGRGGKRRKTKRKRPNTRSRQNRKFST